MRAGGLAGDLLRRAAIGALTGLLVAQASAAAAQNGGTSTTAWSDGQTLSILLGVSLAALAGVALAWRRSARLSVEAGRAAETARREAEGERNRLREEVEGLRAVVRVLPVATWRRDADGRLELLNEPAASIGSDIERTRPLAERAAATGRTGIESRTVVIDGDRRLLEITETPDGSGGVVGAAIDQTSIENLQAQLARQLEAQQEVLGALDTAVAIFGPDRHLLMANDAFADLWRIPRDRLAENPTLAEVLEVARERRRLPEQADFRAWRDGFNRLFQALVEPFEDLLFLPDETTIRMRVTPHAFGGLLMSFEDVTDRLSLERSINTLSQVQRETLDNLHEGIVVFGVDGRLRLLNPTFQAMWGIPDSVTAGLESGAPPHLVEILVHMRDRYPDEVDWRLASDQWTGFLDERVTHSGRVTQIDGRTLDYRVVPLPDGATLINFHDVTDSLAVQRALQEQAEALEMADRMKSEFLANVSYELRTPLNAIIGFSEILRNEYAGPMNDRQKEYAQAILDSSERLVRLVNDILDLASIEAGYLELEQAPVDFDRLTAAIETLVRERARQRGVEFVYSVEAGMPQVLADERRLTQALYNLVANGIGFSATGGTVTLTVATDPAGVAFRVKDRGLPIDADRSVTATARFERGGRQARTEVSLSLVRSLIELHGGSIEVTSSPNDGTEVVARIPLGHRARAADPAASGLTSRVPR